MTGTDLCVNKPVTFPVVFEPPCISRGGGGGGIIISISISIRIRISSSTSS